jgi:hypothetical protein
VRKLWRSLGQGDRHALCICVLWHRVPSRHLQRIEVQQLVRVAATCREGFCHEHRVEIIRSEVTMITCSKIVSELGLFPAAGWVHVRGRPPRIS